MGNIIAAAILAIASSSATAQQPSAGAYVGVAGGSAEHDFGGTAKAVSVFGGYRFGRFFAVEGRFADFGSGTRSEVVDTCPFECIVSSLETIYERRSADRASISLLGIVPIGARFEAFGRVGYGRTQYEHMAGASAPARVVVGNNHANAADVAVGGRFHVAGPLDLRLERERIADAEGEQPITTTWIALEYRFGGG
jgi:hypothetical protein